MKKYRFKATSLQLILVILLVLLVIGAIGGFYYAQDWLNDYAARVNQAAPKTDTAANAQTLSPDQLITSDKITKMTADSDYLMKVTQDLNHYARATGVNLGEISTTSTPAGAPAAPTVNIKPQYILVNLKNPVSYTSLLKFIKAIESNLPVMRITGIDIKNVKDRSEQVNVQPLVIEVYTK